jgi:xanthine dehydrogenase accessory factor
MMQERRRIVELWQRGDAAALVTLVRVTGSSYRRTGARLLIAANGDYAGSISGGCLEAEVLRKAQWLTRAGAVVERYSTMFDDTAEIPYGLGCGGTVDLLLEPAHTPEFELLMRALDASLQGGVQRIVTHLPEDGRPFGRVVCGPAAEFPASFEAKHLFQERLEPPQRLFVLGAGDDAQPMVQMAALLGWSVVVVDGRERWAKPERFPRATRVVACCSSEGLHDAGLTIGGRDAVVLMTHSYAQDRYWLASVLQSAPRYLGLLGARHRSALLVNEVAGHLGWGVDRVCDGLFAPVGLELGGDGAEAIALAVVAEIQACCEGKHEGGLGASRRMTPALVKDLIAMGEGSIVPQAQCAL